MDKDSFPNTHNVIIKILDEYGCGEWLGTGETSEIEMIRTKEVTTNKEVIDKLIAKIKEQTEEQPKFRKMRID